MDERIREDSKNGTPKIVVGKTTFALVVSEIVRRKCLEKEKISREELVSELRKIYPTISDESEGRKQNTSFGIIGARDAFGYVKTSGSNNRIDAVWFDSGKNDIHTPIIDITSDGPVTENKSANALGRESSQSFSKKQIILYGPPGTGKTYNSRRMAVVIATNVNDG